MRLTIGRRRGRRLAALAIAAASAGMSSLARAQPGELSFRAGIERTTGDYGGTVSLDDVFVPFTLRYVHNRLAFRVTVPYIRVELTDATLVDGGSTHTESGLGDTILGLTLRDVVRSDDGSVAIDLTGKIKLPTADENRGLGTGEMDYTLEAGFFKFLGRGALSATLGYKIRGEPPAYATEDTGIISVGGFYRFSGATSGGLSVDFRESAIPGADTIRELAAIVAHDLDERWRLDAYLLRGLSDTSLDWGGGISVRRNF